MPRLSFSARPVLFVLTFSLLTASAPWTPAALAAGPSCTLPGVTVFDDPAGDAESGLAAHDLRSLSIAEPAGLPGQMVFTIKVTDLSLLPPATEWKVNFLNFSRVTNYFVAMNTFNPLRGVVYTYGHYDCSPSVCWTVTDGEADAGEYLSDGTIRVTVSRSKLGGLEPGQLIGSYYAQVHNVPSPTIGTVRNMDYNFVGVDYRVVGNAACAEVIEPPAAPANLAATAPGNSNPNRREVTLTWDDNATDEQFYHVERSTW